MPPAPPAAPAAPAPRPTCTVVLRVFCGDCGERRADYFWVAYVHDEAARLDQGDEDARLFRALLEKVDGLCCDGCTPRQLQRLELLFEWLEEGADRGWARIERGPSPPVISPPEALFGGAAAISRVVLLTAQP